MPTTGSITRRKFLTRAIAATATPYVLSIPAWGKRPPSERITMGIIGVGNMGGGHVDTLMSHDEVQIVAICDVDREKRESYAHDVSEHYAANAEWADYAGIDTYNEYEHVLERDDIDAVLIAVPDHWHAAIAIAACRAGKDVYCEKPLSLTIHEAWEMVRAARRYDRVFQTGSQQRSSSEFHKACSLVRSGRIGRITKVTVNIGEPSWPKVLPKEPIPDGFDWDRWLGPTPWYPYNFERRNGDYGAGWRFIRDTSGGMMTDWGAHHFDIAQWGLGMDGSGPVEIIPPVASGDDPLTYMYADGTPVVRASDANGVLFTGTDGRIEVNRGHFRTWPEEIGQEPLGPGDVRLYESPGHHQDFINCVRTRRRPIADVEIGASTVTVCHLGNIAWWLRRPIRWDPQKREILNDAEAGRWVDRPRRAAYRLHA